MVESLYPFTVTFYLMSRSFFCATHSLNSAAYSSVCHLTVLGLKCLVFTLIERLKNLKTYKGTHIDCNKVLHSIRFSLPMCMQVATQYLPSENEYCEIFLKFLF